MRKDKTKQKTLMGARRHARVRGKVWGASDRPRLSVFRSSKYVSLQLIDDEAGKTLVFSGSSAGAGKKKHSKLETAKQAGKVLAERAKAVGIKKVVFDRGEYAYQGRVRAVAEGAREGGLEF